MSRLFSGTVWDRPPTCERCGRLEAECQCPPAPVVRPQLEPAKQTARVAREKRQKGKQVTVVSGLPAAGNDLPALLTKLKNSLGTGGTIDGDTLVIQGDQVDRVKKFLADAGYRVK
ncbi:MAG: translation initiation factor [Planctomycetota bacterium]|nr:translation initiation factor [Planctomycetota bacterium]